MAGAPRAPCRRRRCRAARAAPGPASGRAGRRAPGSRAPCPRGSCPPGARSPAPPSSASGPRPPAARRSRLPRDRPSLPGPLHPSRWPSPNTTGMPGPRMWPMVKPSPIVDARGRLSSRSARAASAVSDSRRPCTGTRWRRTRARTTSQPRSRPSSPRCRSPTPRRPGPQRTCSRHRDRSPALSPRSWR